MTRRRIAAAVLLIALGSGCAPEAPGEGTAGNEVLGADVGRELDPAEQQQLAVAATFMLQGRPEQVVPALGELLTWQPPHVDVQIVAGHAAYEMGRYGECTERLTDAAQRKPDFVGNSSQLGFAWHKLGDFELANAAFAAAVTARPDAYKAHYGLGLVALGLGDEAAAREHLERALELRPEYLKARAGMARLLEAEGRLEEAAALAQAVVAAWPSNEQAWYLLARVTGRLGRTEEAAAAMDRRAVAYAVREEINALTERLRTGADGPGLHVAIATAYLRTGDEREAARALRTGLARYPEDVDLRALLNELASQQGSEPQIGSETGSDEP